MIREKMSASGEMLLKLIADTLEEGADAYGRPINSQGGVLPRNMSPEEQEELYILARKQGVYALLYDYFSGLDGLASVYGKDMEESCGRVVQGFYRKLEFVDVFFREAKKAGLTLCILKGISLAMLYPHPEYRKSSDVDLLAADRESMQGAEAILEAMGFEAVEDNEQNHHRVYYSPSMGGVELHSTPAEAFGDKNLNRTLDRFVAAAPAYFTQNTLWGVEFTELSPAGGGVELIVHTLQDFLMSGFGLKALVDWRLYWDRELPEGEAAEYIKWIEELGLQQFHNALTYLCIKYLGLPEGQGDFFPMPGEWPEAEALMQDILEGGDGGNKDEERMVAAGGTGMAALIREFHHQMHHNFPRTGGIVVLWPVLWLYTLVKFLYNNKRLKRPSAIRIIKSAGKRGELAEGLGLTGRGIQRK